MAFTQGRRRWIVRRFQHGLAILANQTTPGYGVGRPAGSTWRSPDSFIAGKSDGWMSTVHSGDIGSQSIVALFKCVSISALVLPHSTVVGKSTAAMETSSSKSYRNKQL